jgi:ATP-dependent helicase HrpB
MPKDEVPEIQRADLTEALLFLAHQGITDFKNFSWFEAPSAPLIAAAEKVLRGLGALTAANVLTERGRRLLHYPLPPRLAGLLLAAEEMESQAHAGAQVTAARVAAILQERDFVRDDVIRQHIGDHLECDMTLRLHLLDRIKPKVILQSAEQILRLASRGKSGISNDEPLLLRRLLLRAFADRLCRRRGNNDRALMVGGRGVRLGPESLVKDSEFFLALNGVEGLSDSETTVTLACGFTKDFLLKELGPRAERRRDLFVDEAKGQVFSREARYFEDLALDEPNLVPASAEQIAEKLPDLMAQRFDQVLKRNEALAGWIARWQFLGRHEPAAAEIVFDAPRLKTIFTEATYGEKSLESAAAKDLIYFFEQSIPAELALLLRTEVPDRLQVPTGNRLPVHYPPDRDPYLEVRLQEVFGWTETPKLLRGKVSLILHLLGPNYRPVQVTANLKSFWETAYPEVRKEMRSRYPKHSWPDDPLTAKPEAKGRPRQ